MLFRTYFPVYPLNLFIENFIYYKDFNPSHSLDRFLPDGNINIVFNLTDNLQYIYDNETLKEIQTCRNVWFAGIRNKFITIPSGRESEMFIINFHKGKAYPFVQMPLDELTDSVVDGDLVLSNEIMNLREMIQSAKEIYEKFQCVESYLINYYKSQLTNKPAIDYAVKKIIGFPTNTTISKLSEKIGYSQKHLIKIFKETVGLTPKGFLKIMRFQKAIREIELHQQIDWSKIALESGYYDQAHFIHDFKNFSGFTPQQYIQAKNDQLNYIPVG